GRVGRRGRRAALRPLSRLGAGRRRQRSRRFRAVRLALLGARRRAGLARHRRRRRLRLHDLAAQPLRTREHRGAVHRAALPRLAMGRVGPAAGRAAGGHPQGGLRPGRLAEARGRAARALNSGAMLRTADLEAAVDAILARAGERLVCGAPLGLGKPVPLLNALYARAKAQPRLRLAIITALSLEVPRASGELERRFLEPYARRAFAGVPSLDYMRDLRAGGLPANVELNEFYFRPGAMLGLPAAQQSYISSNYTHVAR